MQVFEVVIALLLGGAALAAIARRFGAPYPALVALAGAALALVPGVPTLVLDPELALALFVAPVLVDAAFDASPRDLRANWRPVASLALGAVALTIVVVAAVARLLVPDMPWAAAIALGAIVAPPDAAAATTVLKQLRPPHRLLVILEGESLFNDASALLVYRLAVGATAAGFLSGWSVLPTLLVVTAGSVALALVLARLTLAVTARISDVSTAVVVQFCTTFGVWILAERLHLSGIITMVVYAMAASRRAPEVMPARIRIPSWAVWEVAVFVLNVLAFILVGFQLKSIAARMTGSAGARYAAVAAAVCVAVILARIAWVTGAAAFSRWRCRPARRGGAQRARRGGRGVVRHAGHGDARRRPRAADRLPLPRPDPDDGVRRHPRHARPPGTDPPSAPAPPPPGRRRLRGPRGSPRARRDASGGGGSGRDVPGGRVGGARASPLRAPASSRRGRVRQGRRRRLSRGRGDSGRRGRGRRGRRRGGRARCQRGPAAAPRRASVRRHDRRRRVPARRGGA